MTIRRKVVRLGAGVVLLAGLFGVSTAPVFADQRPCRQTAPQWYLTGQSNSSPNVSRSGASATINLSNSAFGECLEGEFPVDDGAEAYVMIGPRLVQSGCAGSGSGRCGIQVGITDCRFVGGVGACALDEGSPHYFYRIMGCGATTGIVDLGAANFSNHSYTIYLDSGLVFRMQVDGVEKYSIARSDSRISCWSSNLRKAHWEFRRKDEGDSIGNLSDATVFYDARYGVFGSGWASPGWSTNPVWCEYIANTSSATDFCTTDNADEVYGWTTG